MTHCVVNKGGIQHNRTQQCKDLLFSFTESLFFLILCIASCWDTIFYTTTTTTSLTTTSTTTTCGNDHGLDRRSNGKDWNLPLQLHQIVVDYEAASQQPQSFTMSSEWDHQGPFDQSLITFIHWVSAWLLVIASFVAVISLVITSYYSRGYKRRKDGIMSVVDDVDIVPVEDRMGVSLGSTSVSLLFYNVSKNFCGPRSILYWDIMTLLLCVVGLSFAMSCLLGACRNFRRKNKNIVKNGKEAVVNNMVESRCDCPLADLVFS
jgi:hypothetical protein